MIDLVEELQNYKKVYVLYDSLTTEEILIAQYDVVTVEKRSTMKYFAKLRTNSRHKYFKKELNTVSFRLEFPHQANPYDVYESRDAATKAFCKHLKEQPEKNPKLLNKLKEQYPHYFI